MVGRRIASIAVLLALTACPGGVGTRSGTSPSPSPSPLPRVDTTAACERTTGGGDSFVHLTGVQTETRDRADRVTFEFQTTERGKVMPRYEIDVLTPPITESASGEEIEVQGESFVQLIVHGATGYDLNRSAPTYTGPKELKPDFEILAEAQETGDFEATLNWAFGLKSKSCWKATELDRPLRLVIEFS